MQAGDEREPERRGPDDVDPARATRRLPVGRGRPGEGQRDDPDRDVEVEHPAPGGRRGRPRSASPAARRRRARPPGGPTPRIAAPTTGPAAIPRNVSAPTTPERPRPRRAAEQVRGGRRPDRDEHAAADRLDEPRRDELVERLGGAGQRRPDGEDDERAHEQPPGAPQVGQPAGHRHGQDVDQQVAVDDPARLAQLDPGGARCSGRPGRPGSTAARPP